MTAYGDVAGLVPQIAEAAINTEITRLGFEVNRHKGWYLPNLEVWIYNDGGIYALNNGGWIDDWGGYVPKDRMAYWRRVIPEAFAPWTGLRAPSLAHGPAASLEKALSALRLDGGAQGTVLSAGSVDLAGDVNYVLGEVGGFDGAAMAAFMDQVGSRLAPVISNQAAAVSVFEACLKAEAEIWERSRSAVASIAQATLNAMKDPGSDSGATGVLDVLGAVAALAATVFTDGLAGAAIGTGGTVIRSVSTFMKAGQSDTKEKKLGGDTPDQVFTHLTSALSDLNDDICTEERRIWTSCSKAVSAIQDHVSDFDLGRPKILSDDDAGDYGTPGNIRARLGVLRTIGNVKLPAIAGVLEGANGDVEAGYGYEVFERPGGVGDSPWAEFATLGQEIQQLFGNSAWDLRRAGEVLVLVADDLGKTDDQVHADLAAQTRKVASGSGYYPTPSPNLPPPGHDH